MIGYSRGVNGSNRHNRAATARRRLAAGLIIALLGAGCGGGPSPEDEATSRPLERAIGSEPESLDPHLARTTQAQIVQRDLFEGLVIYSPNGQVAPGVAERWEVSPDGLEYTFYLREDARWSNGDPLTAEDFVYSLQRLTNPATASFYAETLNVIGNASEIVSGASPVSTLGVRAAGPSELTITLARKTPYFLSLLTHPAAMPVHRASVEKLGDAHARPGNMISNGAYVLKAWQLGSVIELARNEYYWNDAATQIDVVRHHVSEEPSAELLRYRAGELDITSTVPTQGFAALKTSRPDELRTAPILNVYFYGMNLNYPPLRESPELREALSMAIDREALVNNVVGRGEKPAYSFVPPGVDNYEAPSMSFEMMSKAARHQRAQQLYRTAGYGPDNPLRLELRYNTSDTHRQIAVAIKDMWKEVLGFEVTLINEEFRVLVANIQAKQVTQLFRLGWNGDYNDALAFLNIFQSDSASNMFGYESDDYDQYIREASEQVDPDRRRSYLEEAEREVLNDHVVIPIYYPVSKHLVSPDVLGWEDNVVDYHYSKDLRFRATDR